MRTIRAGREDGFATAEFAVALPAVVLVLAGLVGTLEALLVHHQAMHAASVGARLAARGEGVDRVADAVRRTGPSGARASTSTRGDLVAVRVTPRVPDAIAWAVPDLSAEVTAAQESQFTEGSEE